MRTEKEIRNLIIDVAKKDKRIRAVYINGSRTNPNVKKDIFQDYDIVYLVTETKSFIEDKEWINVFGEQLIMQLPSELDKIIGWETDFDNCYSYLMQFTDGNRIDLHIKTLEEVLMEINSEKLTIILLNKDNLLPQIPEPTDKDYWIKKPTEELFARCCNEFWWINLNVAKGLWRDEIPYIMDVINSWIRPQLMDMMKWYVGILTEFSCSIGKNNKYIKQYLPDGIWLRYLQSYPHADVESIWNSVFIMVELFEEVTIKVSQELGFSYNNMEALNSITYLKQVRLLSHDATEIF